MQTAIDFEFSDQLGSNLTVVPAKLSAGDTSARKWEQYVAQMVAFNNSRKALNGYFEFPAEFELERHIERSKKLIIQHLIKCRKNEIASSGGIAYDITVDSVIESLCINLHFDFDEVDSFNPINVWNYLVEKYDIKSSTRMAYEDSAKVIIHDFGLSPIYKHQAPKKPKNISGMVCFELNTYLDPYPIGNKKEFSYSSRQSVYDLMTELRSFCKWADFNALADDIENLKNQGFINGAIVSREKTELSDITLITYHSKIEIRFSKALANKLQVFLSKFGADRFAAGQSC